MAPLEEGATSNGRFWYRKGLSIFAWFLYDNKQFPLKRKFRVQENSGEILNTFCCLESPRY